MEYKVYKKVIDFYQSSAKFLRAAQTDWHGTWSSSNCMNALGEIRIYMNALRKSKLQPQTLDLRPIENLRNLEVKHQLDLRQILGIIELRIHS